MIFCMRILSFPNSRYDDQIDSVSQFLKRAEANEPRFALVGGVGKVFCGGREVPTGHSF